MQVPHSCTEWAKRSIVRLASYLGIRSGHKSAPEQHLTHIYCCGKASPTLSYKVNAGYWQGWVHSGDINILGQIRVAKHPGPSLAGICQAGQAIDAPHEHVQHSSKRLVSTNQRFASAAQILCPA